MGGDGGGRTRGQARPRHAISAVSSSRLATLRWSGVYDGRTRGRARRSEIGSGKPRAKSRQTGSDLRASHGMAGRRPAELRQKTGRTPAPPSPDRRGRVPPTRFASSLRPVCGWKGHKRDIRGAGKRQERGRKEAGGTGLRTGYRRATRPPGEFPVRRLAV